MDISTKTSSANLASSRLGRRSLVVWGAIAVGMAAIGGRITCVNAAAPKPTPVETYSLGETVPLDGAFGDVAEEGTKGYSVRLDGVSAISYNDFVPFTDDGSSSVVGRDAPSIVDLRVTIINDGNDSGYLDLLAMTLVPVRKNAYYQADFDLIRATQHVMRESGNPGWVVVTTPDTEFSLHIPYVNTGLGSARYDKVIADREFDWVLTNAPVRKVIHFSL